MPRVSEAEKIKSYKRIVDSASKMMRARGIEATSVSDVMKEAGLTHGGFYRHFDSKEALVSAAFEAAVEEVLAEVDAAADGPAREAARKAYVARYLSEQHRDDRANGCPLAALGSEIIRAEGPAQREASQTVERVAHILSDHGPHSIDRGYAQLALLLGTITLARLAERRDLALEILDAGRRAHDLLQDEL